MGKTIVINGIEVPVIDDVLSGRELKELGGVPEDRVLVRQEPDRNVIVPDHLPVRLAGNEVFAHHAHHSKGDR